MPILVPQPCGEALKGSLSHRSFAQQLKAAPAVAVAALAPEDSQSICDTIGGSPQQGFAKIQRVLLPTLPTTPSRKYVTNYFSSDSDRPVTITPKERMLPKHAQDCQCVWTVACSSSSAGRAAIATQTLSASDIPHSYG